MPQSFWTEDKTEYFLQIIKKKTVTFFFVKGKILGRTIAFILQKIAMEAQLLFDCTNLDKVELKSSSFISMESWNQLQW